MKKLTNSNKLTEYFFRNEYGKMVAVITRYIGTENVETAEDIVQETLLKATDHWQNNGIPKNPEAWLYTTAKNLTFNILKRKKHQRAYETATKKELNHFEEIDFSEDIISDEQLKMMFACCDSSISENSQITLILKILCGFSISEISNSFFTTKETINKRLVRGRKKLKENNLKLNVKSDISTSIDTVLKTVYLLFNEGYYPSQKNELIRFDLCFEAIRLVKILIKNNTVKHKTNCYALLALMYLNAARFDARFNEENLVIELEKQDRKKWNQELIQQGIHYLNLATNEKQQSTYLILATISANHCISKSFDTTNWEEILSLYDKLIEIEDSPITRLNRSIPLSYVKGNKTTIKALQELEMTSDIGKYHLFHLTLGEIYKRDNKTHEAIRQFEKAITLAKNNRDINLLKKKLLELVPN